MNAVIKTSESLSPEIIESLVLDGDLSRLTPEQRVSFYRHRCQQAGLDPAAQPFSLLRLNNKLVLYANATATQQLCGNHKLTTAITSREKMDDIYAVCCRVTSPDGRSSENMGAVPIGGLKGDALANAMLKATTKAIRRTVLAHLGLGMMDETEVQTIPGAQMIAIDKPDLTADPRGDLSHVDDAEVLAWVAKVKDVLAKDIDEDAQALELFDIHTSLAGKNELYIAMADALSNGKILSKKQWKDAVAAGKEIAHKLI